MRNNLNPTKIKSENCTLEFWFLKIAICLRPGPGKTGPKFYPERGGGAGGKIDDFTPKWGGVEVKFGRGIGSDRGGHASQLFHCDNLTWFPSFVLAPTKIANQ